MAVRRRFLVLGHDATVDPSFSLGDLAGGAGRMDVLVRVLTNALCVSHGVRTDTEVWLALVGDDERGPRTVRFDGASVRNLNPDERSAAALVKKALAVDVVPNGVFEPAHPGVSVAEMPYSEAVVRFSEAGPVVLLDREGEDLRAAADETLGMTGGAPGFVLSDHRPLAQEEHDDAFRVAEGRRVSVGPEWLQGHQVVTLVHDELDRRGR
ncbi:MAG: tRNA (pseudouridine(54)-N(1))-methyltransferase TrmY [Euryarchaeota archaeon]|nr:tRNA (pseudouridine(54)-N(1))-methyltransferase TrmY [Euryarchaeota archaeon]